MAVIRRHKLPLRYLQPQRPIVVHRPFRNLRFSTCNHKQSVRKGLEIKGSSGLRVCSPPDRLSTSLAVNTPGSVRNSPNAAKRQSKGSQKQYKKQSNAVQSSQNGPRFAPSSVAALRTTPVMSPSTTQRPPAFTSVSPTSYSPVSSTQRHLAQKGP